MPKPQQIELSNNHSLKINIGNGEFIIVNRNDTDDQKQIEAIPYTKSPRTIEEDGETALIRVSK